MEEMEDLLTIMWHVPTVMAVLLAAGLIMGQRQVGELSVFDLLTGIAIGAVAGAGIVDTDIPFLPMLVGILGLALLHFAVTWLKMKWKAFGRLATFEPTVVVQNGVPLRKAMGRVRMTVPDLLPLLREKDIFDLREVEYAVLEPDGKVTVLKVQNPPRPKGLTRAVIVDGEIETKTLHQLGWDHERLRDELRRQGLKGPADIFIATLDEGGSLYAVPMQRAGEGPRINH